MNNWYVMKNWKIKLKNYQRILSLRNRKYDDTNILPWNKGQRYYESCGTILDHKMQFLSKITIMIVSFSDYALNLDKLAIVLIDKFFKTSRRIK